MATTGLRVGVLGASGALGSEVLAVLDGSSLRVGAVVPIGSDRSLGRDVEFQGEIFPVVTGLAPVDDLDLLFLCAPPGVSLDVAREAFDAELPCVDCSGGLVGASEVPLRVAAFDGPEESLSLVATPGGAALALALALHPLAARAGLAHVAGTLLESASVGGRSGIEALYAESVALFNQHDPPEPDCFGRPVAFDALPSVGVLESSGDTDRECEVARSLARLLVAELSVALTVVQIPTFVSLGAALVVRTREPLSRDAAAELLARAPGVEIWAGVDGGPSTRAAAGRDVVLVGRVRQDPARDRELQLWLACDPLRLVAHNAVALAERLVRARS
jgi:aspartate-semialdehyde dehydrogenase